MEGGVFWLNGLSRVLVKTEFYKEVHRQAQEKLQKLLQVWSSKESLPKVRLLVCFLVLFTFKESYTRLTVLLPGV